MGTHAGNRGWGQWKVWILRGWPVSLQLYLGISGKYRASFQCSVAPGDGMATVSWDAPPEIALKTITGFNVYEVKRKVIGTGELCLTNPIDDHKFGENQ